MILTYKYRIKDRSARKVLNAHAYACNQIWNWCAAQHRNVLDKYRAGARKRKWATAFDLAMSMRGIGQELGIHQQTVQSVCDQWAKSRSVRYRASFGTKRSLGWVPFQQQSRRIDGNSVVYRGKRFRFFGAKRRPVPENAKGGYFCEDSQGRWFVCFQVEVQVAKAVAGEIGIDLGLKSLATLSTGEVIENPRHLSRYAERLAIAQRSGNKRRATAINTEIANVRRDFHHKLSTRLCRDYALIAVGDINAQRLAQTRMAKSVNDAGWSSFRAMLAYKATKFVLVDEKFTTQTCSSCGALPPERPKGIAGLGIREWECSSCGESHDRDVNAAKNILKFGRSAAPLAEGSRRVAA
jgi:IS605 OrfB family transposase